MAFTVVVASANFTRPADTTAYTSGDLVANNVTAASVVPMQFTAALTSAGAFMVRRARLKKTTSTTSNASFRLHLYGADPSASSGIANGDNGAWSTKQATWIGDIDLDISGSAARVFTDATEVIAAVSVGSEISHQLASGQVCYGLLEARAAYVPGSAEVFTVELEIVQN